MQSPELGEEDAEQNRLSFSEKKLRQAFVRKVFLIITFQLVITCLIIAPLMLYEPARLKIASDSRIYLASFVVFFVVNFVIICCNALTRSYPQSYILLGVLTISTALWVGCICAKYEAYSVLIALGLTSGLCFLLALFASQTKIDFTPFLGVMMIFALGLLLVSIVYIFWPSQGLRFLLIYGGAAMCCFYFIIDVQMIVGGNHRFSLSPEDYALAAALLYVDIIYLFVYMLMIFGDVRS